MKNLLIMVALILLFVQGIYSQDTLFMRDGKIISGERVIEVNRKDVLYMNKDTINEILTIPRNNINIIKYKYGSVDIFEPAHGKHIDTTHREHTSPTHRKYTDTTQLSWKSQIPKYYNITELTLNPLGIQHVIGLRDPYVYFGIGTGIYHYKAFLLTLIPFFLDFRVSFTHGKLISYFLTDVGYSIALGPTWHYGQMINPAIGIKFSISNKQAINVSIGYRIQKFSRRIIENSEQSGIELRTINLKTGFEF